MAERRDEDDDDTPLDPAMERVQAKLKRLILVSGLTLGIGLLAVVAAIIFRVNRDTKLETARWESRIELPAGTTILATALDGERLAITVEHNGERAIHLIDIRSGRQIGIAQILYR